MRTQLRAMAAGKDHHHTLVDQTLACPDALEASQALAKALAAPDGGSILPPSGWLHPV